MKQMIIRHRDKHGFIYHTETVNTISVQELIEMSNAPQPVLTQEEIDSFDPYEVFMQAARDSARRV